MREPQKLCQQTSGLTCTTCTLKKHQRYTELPRRVTSTSDPSKNYPITRLVKCVCASPIWSANWAKLTELELFTDIAVKCAILGWHQSSGRSGKSLKFDMATKTRCAKCFVSNAAFKLHTIPRYYFSAMCLYVNLS